MTFGHPSEFLIEAYHEPESPKWAGFGRMAIQVGGVVMGDISEEHCSLHHAVDVLRELRTSIETLWEPTFENLTDEEVFKTIDEAIYTGECLDKIDIYRRFDFLTNTGEHFDDVKTFIGCTPCGEVRVWYLRRCDQQGTASCQVTHFREAVEAFVRWFDEQVAITRCSPREDSRTTASNKP